jgi:hypothetical protein
MARPTLGDIFGGGPLKRTFSRLFFLLIQRTATSTLNKRSMTAPADAAMMTGRLVCSSAGTVADSNGVVELERMSSYSPMVCANALIGEDLYSPWGHEIIQVQNDSVRLLR